MAKRLLDIIASALGLFFLSPLFLIVSFRIWREMGRPIFFRQTRPGMGGKPFQMYKFRSMREAIDSHGKPLSDSERLTAIGRSLRASSIDELPELWNVLRGEMSLVGPRPLAMEYLSLYSTEQFRRHEVKPGITGWAQINGRNSATWTERFAYDVWYVDNHSMKLDLWILRLTVKQALAKEDVQVEGQSAIESFNGRN